MLRAIAMLWFLAVVGCAADRFAVAHVWGAARGAVADRWYIETPVNVRLAPDGRFAVLVGEDGATSGFVDYKAVLVASPSGARVAEVTAHASDEGATFSADGRRFAVVDIARGCAAIWSVEPARELSCVPVGATVRFARVALSPDGEALAIIEGGGRLSRWSVASPSRVWTAQIASLQVPPVTVVGRFLVWPVSDVILAATDAVAARDAATGSVRWVHPDDDRDSYLDKYLGVVGRDAVMTGRFYDRPGSGPIARIDLTTGKIRDLSGDADLGDPRGGAVLSDGTVIVIDGSSIAHRVRLGGAEVGSAVLPTDTSGFSAQRDGRFALVLAPQGIVPWDLVANAPAAVDDSQHARILALDADELGVVAIAEDGSVLARDRDGRLRSRGQMRAPTCRAAAVSITARIAACAIELNHRYRQVEDALKTHEWLALDGGNRGAFDVDQADAIAIDRAGAIWTTGNDTATWLDTRRSVSDDGYAAYQHQSLTGSHPRVGQIVSGGQAVAYGGMSYISAQPDGHGDSAWVGNGLDLVTRDGHVTTLDRDIAVFELGSNREGDRLVVGSFDEVQLWRRTGAATAWARQWSIKVDLPQQSGKAELVRAPSIASVAVSDDGSRVAVAVGREHRPTVELYDGATSARLASVVVDGRLPSTLAFGGDRLYGGTSDGRVVVFSLPRR